MNRKEINRRKIRLIGGLCLLAFVGLLARVVLTPIAVDTPPAKIRLLADPDPALIPIPSEIELVVKKNIMVPSREGGDINAFAELAVKGVILYGDRQKVILATSRDLSKDLLVEKGEEHLLPRLAKNTQDPLFQIYQFFRNWRIIEITQEYMKVRHMRTEKVETYPVDFQPEDFKKRSPGPSRGRN